MSKAYFTHIPDQLDPAQRVAWLRRQRTAENTLEIQAIGGSAPDAETVAHFQRYVNGEITLAQAIERVRRQMAQEHETFRLYLTRRNLPE
jgi:hypothetical protein